MSQPSKPLVMGTGARLPPPTFADLLAAFAILTPIPGERPARQSDRFARANLFFPLVGLTLGLALAAAQRMLAPFCNELLLAVGLVSLWTVLTLPTANLPTSNREQFLLSFSVLAAKVLALFVGAHGRELALLLAPLLGCWSLVVLSIGARDGDAPGRKFNPSIAFREFGWTSVFTGAVLTWCADAVGILIFVTMAAAALILRLLCHRLFGGVTWRSLCACMHIVEALLLVALTAL